MNLYLESCNSSLLSALFWSPPTHKKGALPFWEKTRHILDHKALYTLYCSLVLPYLSYCVEVWGNTYKSTLQALCIRTKSHKNSEQCWIAGTHNLFLKKHALKLRELVEFKTAQIMYMARNNLLPGNIYTKTVFRQRGGGGGCNLRGKSNLKQHYIRTTLKSMCISKRGVILWNGLEEEAKQSKTIIQFF